MTMDADTIYSMRDLRNIEESEEESDEVYNIQ
jgi:hypothetical protein